MTPKVDHAELKRLAEGALHDPRYDGRSFETAANPAVVLELLSEIEGLKARIKCLEKLGGEQSLRVMQQATRAKDAENELAHLRTQAPDSWRPDREAVARWLLDHPNDLATIAHSDPAHAIIAAFQVTDAILRPQTAESGK